MKITKQPYGATRQLKRTVQGLAVGAITGLTLLLATSVASAAEGPTTTAATDVTAVASSTTGATPCGTDSLRWG
jgi:hypothetical protein